MLDKRPRDPSAVPLHQNERNPRHAPIVDDTVGDPIYNLEQALDADTATTETTPSPIEALQETVHELEDETEQLAKSADSKSLPILRGLASSLSGILDRLKGLVRAKEVVEALSSENTEALEAARQAIVELPDNPEVQNVHSALLTLVDKLPLTKENPVFTGNSTFRKILEGSVKDTTSDFVLGVTIREVLKEVDWRTNDPSNKPLYEQIDDLALALVELGKPTVGFGANPDHYRRGGTALEPLSRQELFAIITKPYTKSERLKKQREQEL